MLKVENINSHYGRLQVLWDVNLHVESGELICLIGANGAGKTTLMSVISGIHNPSSGQVLFQEKDITKLSPAQRLSRGIALIPEGRKLFTSMTVLENLEMGAYIYRRNSAAVQQEIKRIFKIFPVLEERSKQTTSSLSGGEQQMLAIARGLMSRPKMLLLDEPSLGLAPIMVTILFNVIKDIHQEGLSVLLVEQNATASLKMAQRAYVFETGRVVLEGTGAELLGNKKIVDAYLGGS
jgi:branched-chain amino acid transport system ATP-binding protein